MHNPVQHQGELARLLKRQRVLPPALESTTTPVRAAASTNPRAAAATTTTRRGRQSLFTRTSTTPTAAVTTTPAAVDTATRRRTTAAVVTTSPAAEETTQARAVTSASSAVNSSPPSSSAPATSNSSSAPRSSSSASSDASSTGSKSNGGTIAGVIIAIVVVVALIVGVVLWRKKRANRARGSGTALVGGGGGGFQKQKNADEDDEMFGNSSTGGSPFHGGEKFGAAEGGSYGAMSGAVTGAGVGGWAAQQQHQPQQQARRPSWDAPNTAAYGQPQPQQSNGSAYPPVMASTTNLLGSNPSTSNFGAQPSHNEIESREMQQHLDSVRAAQLKAAGLSGAGAGTIVAGAAGIGATKLAQQQQQVTSPFGGDQPGEGAVHVVKRTFEPSLDDELVLAPGNHVQLLVKYDDGWALGINLDSPGNPPAKGVFPFDCLGEVVPANGATSSTATQQGQPPVAQPLTTITESDSLPTSPIVAAAPAPAEPRESEELGYLAYDQAEEDPTESAAAAHSVHSHTSSTLPPQLPTLRSDSPIDFSSAAPSAAPIPAVAPASAPAPPQIQILDPAGETAQGSAVSEANADYFSPRGGQAQQGLAAGVREGEKSKRTSSLIASRDADLFVALGEVLGRREGEDEEQSGKEEVTRQ